MTITHLTDLSSPRLDPYRHLRISNLTRFSGRFIAESKPLVERLLASKLRVESVLIDEKFVDEAKAWVADSHEILVVPSHLVSELIGFHFHRGYLACGLRPDYRELKSDGESLLKPQFQSSDPSLPRWTGILLVGVQDPENMGSILRTCSALGIQDVVIGPHCVDPFARRVLRVSMGNAFKLRFWESKSPVEAIGWFRELGVESVAACLAPTSEELSRFVRSGDTLVLFGNEAHGLPPEIVEIASRKLLIQMDLQTDSLNVSVAAGIILHNLCRIC